jgi:hypothetical protein
MPSPLSPLYPPLMPYNPLPPPPPPPRAPCPQEYMDSVIVETMTLNT